MLDCDYIKNCYSLTGSSQFKLTKKLDAHPKVIQQRTFIGQLKNTELISMVKNPCFLTILEKKIKETRLKFSQGCAVDLLKLANYVKARVKLTNT